MTYTELRASLDALLPFTDPDTPIMVEVRHSQRFSTFAHLTKCVADSVSNAKCSQILLVTSHTNPQNV